VIDYDEHLTTFEEQFELDYLDAEEVFDHYDWDNSGTISVQEANAAYNDYRNEQGVFHPAN